jgi:hypothetical protein
LQKRTLTQNFSKKYIFKTEDNVPPGKLKEKNMAKTNFFAYLKFLKKGVGSGVVSGSGSIRQRCGSESAAKYHGSPTLVF